MAFMLSFLFLLVFSNQNGLPLQYEKCYLLSIYGWLCLETEIAV
jgi:hypothetical protein